MRFLEGTTRQTLTRVYNLWMREPIHGLRFGQYFWNEYGKLSESWPTLFYETSSDKAYMLAFHELPEE